MAGFAEMLATLESADFFIGVLPFVITYSIFYITLRNSPKFKEDEHKKHTALVSIAIAFLVSYYVISQGIMQMFFVNYFGTLTIGLLGIMGLFVALALTGLHDWASGLGFWIIPVVVLVGAAWTTSGGLTAFTQGNSTGALAFVLAGFDYLVDTGLIWALLIVGVVAWTISDEDDKEGGFRDFLMSHPGDGGEH